MKQSYRPDTKTLSLEIPGDVLSTNVQTLRADLMPVVESENAGQPWTVLELDLRKARMVDSAGLNLIVAVIRAAEQRGRKLRALIANAHIQRTFLFTRLDRHLELVMAQGGSES